MIEKTFNNARIVHKGDIEANWKKAKGFIPLAKEIIIYLPDENYSYSRMKIGDGVNGINDLPFFGGNIEGLATEDWVIEQANLLTEGLQEYINNSVQGLVTEEYVDGAIAAIETSQPDWNQNDETEKDYIKNKPFGVEVEEIPEKIYAWDKATVLNNYKVKVAGGWPSMYWIKISNDTPNSLLNSEVSYFSMGISKNYIVQSEMIINGTGYYKVQQGNSTSILVITNFQQASEELNLSFAKNGLYIEWWDGYYSYPTSIKAYNIVCENIKYLDEKYIPNSIARITDVPIVDQIYNAESVNAQSGVAISEAIGPISIKNTEQDDKIAELEGKVTIATFNTSEATGEKITLKNLEGVTKIDWGDGVIDTNLTHTYETTGEYVCKIYDLNSIGRSAFVDCKALKSINISNTVNMIGTGAFVRCEGLTSVVIPDSVTTVDTLAFGACLGLTNIIIPNSVTSLGAGIFKNCSSLINVVIGNSVTTIGEKAFEGCTSLISISIPGSVTTIRQEVFKGCIELTTVTFKGYNPPAYGLKCFENCSNLATIYVPYGTSQVYKEEWAGSYGVTQELLDKIVESDREAYMSDVDALKIEIQEQLVGKIDYLGTVTGMADLSVIAGAGDYHRVSTEFVYDEVTGEVAHVGDILIAVIDLTNLTGTQTKEYWDLVHTELSAAPATSEDITNIFNEEA